MEGTGVIIRGKPEREWVIMYYFQGNNNISRDTIYKVGRLETAGSSDKVVTVALTSEPKGTEYEGVRMYEIAKRSTPPDPNSPTISSKPFYISKDEDAASPDTLKKFILTVMKRYPAKHYALIMMDHGFGFLGGMDNSNGKFMDIRDMEKVLQEVKRETGKGIDILGFDACLMSQLEVAKQFVGEAKYLVASQDLEHPYGWEEGKIVKRLIEELEKRSLSPKEVALIMGEVNAEHPEAMKTISVLDLSKVDGLVNSLDSLAQELLKLPIEDVKEMMRETPHMCHYFPNDKLCTNYRDLRSFLQQVINYAKAKKKTSLLLRAKRAIKALDRVVLFSKNSGEEVYKDNQGLSTYLPPDGMLIRYYRTYEKLAKPENVVQTPYSQGRTSKGVIQNPKKVWMALQLAKSAPQWRKLMESLGEDTEGIPNESY